MLHTQFQGNQPTNSGEEDFLSFFLYIGMAAILVLWHTKKYNSNRLTFFSTFPFKRDQIWPCHKWP